MCWGRSGLQPSKPGTGLLIIGETWCKCSNASLSAEGDTSYQLCLFRCSMPQQPIKGLWHQQLVGDAGLSEGVHIKPKGDDVSCSCADDTWALASLQQLLWSLAGWRLGSQAKLIYCLTPSPHLMT